MKTTNDEKYKEILIENEKLKEMIRLTEQKLKPDVKDNKKDTYIQKEYEKLNIEYKTLTEQYKKCDLSNKQILIENEQLKKTLSIKDKKYIDTLAEYEKLKVEHKTSKEKYVVSNSDVLINDLLIENEKLKEMIRLTDQKLKPDIKDTYIQKEYEKLNTEYKTLTEQYKKCDLSNKQILTENEQLKKTLSIKDKKYIDTLAEYEKLKVEHKTSKEKYVVPNSDVLINDLLVENEQLKQDKEQFWQNYQTLMEQYKEYNKKNEFLYKNFNELNLLHNKLQDDYQEIKELNKKCNERYDELADSHSKLLVDNMTKTFEKHYGDGSCFKTNK